MRPVAGQAEAAGRAAVGRIERAEAADDVLVDGALRHLIGRIPAVGIGHRRQRKAVGGGALAVAQHAVDLAYIVGHVPGAVIFGALDRGEQRAGADRRRAGGDPAQMAKTAEADLREVFRQPAEIVDIDGACGSEIALVGEVWPLADIDRPDQFRNQEIDVGVTLTMSVARHVDRHAVDRDGEIGAVVEIEAAQKILVGFALAGMLGHDQPRHRLQQFADPRGRTRIEFLAADPGLAGGSGLQIRWPRNRGAGGDPGRGCRRLAGLGDRRISRASLAARRRGLPDPPLLRFRRHHRHRRKLVCPGIQFESSVHPPERPRQGSTHWPATGAWKAYATPMPPHDNCYNRPAHTGMIRQDGASLTSPRLRGGGSHRQMRSG